MRRFILSIALLWLPTAAMAECDFDEKVGSCSATITINSTSGSKGSYSAEATVRSSADSCSKVEYYLDNTPHTSVIKNGSSTDETFFGQKPISKKSIQIKKCTQFASKGPGSKAAGKGDDQVAAAGPKYFEGRRKGFVGLLIVGGPVELDIQVSGNRATGISDFPSNNASERIDGTIQGNVLRYSYVVDGDTQNIVLTRKTDKTLSYRGNAGISGTLTRY
ncbi:hypothetical protein [Rhizobium sp. BK176]|uniref:hypothetical protein n=1 Tax=Rhizobium sp. BK176 TaxID=2587071 RepID=UPI0021681A57|nr:hypothetical protein [Rhizobium sp. BK176]MCS4089230.1 hypothetical protein [Rhizobium sp. BK176]